MSNMLGRTLALFILTAAIGLPQSVVYLRKGTVQLAGEYNGSTSQKENTGAAAITGYGASVIACVEPDVATGDHDIFQVSRGGDDNQFMGVQQRNGTFLRVYAAGASGFDSVARSGVFAQDTKVCVAGLFHSGTSFSACSSNGTPGCDTGSPAPGAISSLDNTYIGKYVSQATGTQNRWDGEIAFVCAWGSDIGTSGFLTTFLGGGSNKNTCIAMGADFVWSDDEEANEGDGGTFTMTQTDVTEVPF